jgi:anti-sigma regulatory factor (Ser/Thr protein kinase)
MRFAGACAQVHPEVQGDPDCDGSPQSDLMFTMNTRRATVPDTVVARDQIAARRGAERLFDRPTTAVQPAAVQEAILAQRDEALRAMAATVAALRLKRPSPEQWAVNVLRRYGLDPEPGADPAAVAAGVSGRWASDPGSADDSPGGVGRTAEFVAEMHTPRDARRFAAAALRDWQLPESVLADTVTIVSELVTNAVRHARFPPEGPQITLVVKLSAGGDQLTLEVHDPDAAKLPVWKAPPPSRAVQDPATHSGEAGAGLRIVAALADRYGYTVSDDGKAVWAGISALPRSPDFEEPPAPSAVWFGAESDV